MNLSDYHKKYQERDDDDMKNRINVKEEELRKILTEVGFETENDTVKIGVLGCGEKRFVSAHKEIFQKLLEKEVDITTMDITIDHLEGEEGVVQHDIINPLPNAPYDILFGHVVLKFIPTENQFTVLINSHNALASGGIAIHVFDLNEIQSAEPILPDGYFAVSLKDYKKQLDDTGIKYQEVSWEVLIEGIGTIPGHALVLFKE